MQIANCKSKIACLAVALAALLQASAASVANPYTFVGRVMDSKHDAFDADRKATINAKDSSGDVLATSWTFFREGTRSNYSLAVPVSTSEVDGYAVQGQRVEITVVDDVGKTWAGVVQDTTIGASGGVREVDIVLGEDNDGDGIDDSLYEELEAQWEDSDYWRWDEDFDPNKDYDGDGISTIAEALSGTNPFDPEDCLKIAAFTHAGGAGQTASLTFTGVAGRAYSIEEATSLSAKVWKSCEIQPSEGASYVNYIVLPADASRKTFTVYLLPTSAASGFYRVRAD